MNTSPKPSVIYIHLHLFTPYMAKLFCTESIARLGAKIEVWDVSELVGLSKTQNQPVFETFKIKNIKNKRHLFLLIKKNRYAIFATSINPEKRFFWIYFYLSYFKCSHIKILNGLTASYGATKYPLIAKLRSLVKKNLLYILDKIHLFSAPTLVFLPGNFWNNILIGNPKIVQVNHFLYDDFLISQKNTHNIDTDKYILFLDEYHPLHPDWNVVCNKEYLISSKEYFSKMQQAFDYFEKKFNLPVIVAAHPKASYLGDEFGTGMFGLRKIIQNQTDNLAYNAQIFLAHGSTSRFLALFHRKPLYHIFLNAFNKYPYSLKSAYNFAKDLHMPISYESNGFAIEETKVNSEIYQNVLFKFCSSKETDSQITYSLISQQIYLLAKEKYDSSTHLC